MNRSRLILIIIVICLSFLSILFSLSKGSMSISLDQLLFSHSDQFSSIFFELRLPRTVAAFTCGGLLALSGVLMQLLLQNPLADPYVLGMSSGGALVTLIMMLLGLNEVWMSAGTWIGCLLTMLLISLLARKHHWHAHSLLLIGVALACGFSAGISLILLMSPNSTLHDMLFWLSGDLNAARFPRAGLTTLSVGLIICCLLAREFNLLSRGQTEAQALGLSYQHYHIILFLLSSFFTAQAVMLAGCIGFIGLIVPHMIRLLGGYDHRVLLPLSVFLGGSLLTLADTFARTLIAPEQLPVGILLAIIGVPTFVWLMQK